MYGGDRKATTGRGKGQRFNSFCGWVFTDEKLHKNPVYEDLP